MAYVHGEKNQKNNNNNNNTHTHTLLGSKLGTCIEGDGELLAARDNERQFREWEGERRRKRKRGGGPPFPEGPGGVTFLLEHLREEIVPGNKPQDANREALGLQAPDWHQFPHAGTKHGGASRKTARETA